MDKHQSLLDFPLQVTLPVLWSDMDAMRHVNNTRYLVWFESSRIAYWEQAGLHDEFRRIKIGPILASTTCHYRRQLDFPDTVHIGARVSRLGRTSMTMEHRLVGQSHGQIAAEGEATVVLFDYERQRPEPIPATLRELIEQFEGRPLS